LHERIGGFSLVFEFALQQSRSLLQLLSKGSESHLFLLASFLVRPVAFLLKLLVADEKFASFLEMREILVHQRLQL
jgi:hypothetical protein